LRAPVLGDATVNGLADFDCVDAAAFFGGFRRGKSNAGTRNVGSAS
jgi:hypothetical protein